MSHRWLNAAALLPVLALLLPAASLGDDKSVQNVKGTVSYQAPNAAVVPIALNATIPLADSDVAITGGASLAALNLPDSSQVLVGSDSKVQLAYFNGTPTASAKFVLYDGRVRFAVRHPQGAKADYTFTTPTGSVGVRGTQGDVEYDPNGALRVNVYELCDPNKPVVVTTKGGSTYTLIAGQSLLAQLVNGIVQTQVQQLTQQLIDRFSPEFGVPTSWDAATGEVANYAQSQAAGAVNNATGGYGGQYVPNLGGLLGGGKKAKPSPSPASSTCS
jgi:hypothetical protein